MAAVALCRAPQPHPAVISPHPSFVAWLSLHAAASASAAVDDDDDDKENARPPRGNSCTNTAKRVLNEREGSGRPSTKRPRSLGSRSSSSSSSPSSSDDTDTTADSDSEEDHHDCSGQEIGRSSPSHNAGDEFEHMPPPSLSNRTSRLFRPDGTSILSSFHTREMHGRRMVSRPVGSYASDLRSQRDDIYRTACELSPPFVCTFSKNALDGQLLAVADEDGVVSFYDTRFGAKHDRENSRAKIEAHANAVFDCIWTHDDRYLVTASGDQTAALWDVERRTRLGAFEGHTCSIKSIRSKPSDPNVFASGGRDGKVLIWDIRCGSSLSTESGNAYKPMVTIRNAHCTKENAEILKRRKRASADRILKITPQSVTAVEFMIHNANFLASAGASDGCIKYWDLRYTGSWSMKDFPTPATVSTPPSHHVRPHGITSLSLDSHGTKLVASCTDHTVYAFDTWSPDTAAVQEFKADKFECNSFYIKTAISPDSKWVACGSSFGGNVFLWELDQQRTSRPQRAFALPGHELEVTSVAWGRSETWFKLASCSDDYSVRTWSYARRPRADDIDDLVGSSASHSSYAGDSNNDDIFATDIPSTYVHRARPQPAKSSKARESPAFSSAPSAFSSTSSRNHCLRDL